MVERDLSMTPKQERRKDPTKVQDVDAEKGIKWNFIAQAVLIAILIGGGSIAIDAGKSFGTSIVNGIDKINDTLIDVRKEMSNLNTGVEINKSTIIDVKEDINNMHKRVSDNTDLINEHLINRQLR